MNINISFCSNTESVILCQLAATLSCSTLIVNQVNSCNGYHDESTINIVLAIITSIIYVDQSSTYVKGSGSHIRTILCRLFAVVLAVVVLTAIYLGHIYNCYVM